ncbi:hypothetical protein BJV77DRAFT_678230 [Russula vinacea]|nr:hypothetical protein BJV77DRAFT_678230 [Russula vinacea]
MNSDFACRDDCYYDFPSSLPQPFVTSPSDTTDPLLPGTAASPIIFTDNARMRLGDLIRRQCFNCRATETRTWRRSVLNPGKMVCNKCGLFERSHASPRPNTLPHKHRLRPTPVYPDMDPASDRVENSQLNGRPFTDSFTGHFSNAFGSPGEATTPHDTTWVNHSVFPTTSHLGFHPPSTAPAETAYPPSHLGVSRHPPGVVENWCFDSAS